VAHDDDVLCEAPSSLPESFEMLIMDMEIPVPRFVSCSHDLGICFHSSCLTRVWLVSGSCLGYTQSASLPGYISGSFPSIRYLWHYIVCSDIIMFNVTALHVSLDFKRWFIRDILLLETPRLKGSSSEIPRTSTSLPP